VVALVITSGPRSGERIDITGELTVGREDTDVELNDSEVSRRHVVLRPVAAGVEIEDLGSRNGTRVNGERVGAPVTVSENASIEIGETTLRLEIRAAVTQAHAPPRSAETQPSGRNGEDAVTAAKRERTQPRTSPPPMRPATATAAPAQEFGAFRAAPRRGRRQVATRLWVPMVMTYVAVAGTAGALIVYFAQR
jgi:pSer/pThr/pTyr-binding forkhead associated (FHA) protein